MADDSRRSGGVSGLELLSGRRIRIEKKMLKNLNVSNSKRLSRLMWSVKSGETPGSVRA